jgi:hypothetical protein
MKKGIDIHEASYHPDGKYEGVQNDMPSAKIGVRSNTSEVDSPFHVSSLSEDEAMKKFKKMMGSTTD